MPSIRFTRGQVFHMTTVERLPAILASNELRCDALLDGLELPGNSIAHSHLKDRRRDTPVDAAPGGMIADYVPFYFAPRSPMLYANYMGGVAGRPAGEDGIVYLVSTCERVAAVAEVVIANRCSYRRADFSAGLARLEDPYFLDWDVLFDSDFRDQPNDTGRKDRRQAELLAHRRVPMNALLGVAAKTSEDLVAVQDCCGTAQSEWHFSVRRDWYFG